MVGGVTEPPELGADSLGADEVPGELLLGGLVLEPGALGLGVLEEPEPDAEPLASNLANSAASRLPSLLVSSVFHCFVSSLLSAASRLLSLPFLSLSIAARSALAPASALPLTLGLGLLVDGALGLVDGELELPLLPPVEGEVLGGVLTCAAAVKLTAAAVIVVIAKRRCSFILPPKLIERDVTDSEADAAASKYPNQ